MLPADAIRFLILLAIFASVFLLIQLVLRVTVEQRAHAGAVNKRLKMIASGASREDIVGVLRKNDPLLIGEDSGIVGKLYVGLHRKLAMAAVPFTATQVVIAMGAIFAAL